MKKASFLILLWAIFATLNAQNLPVFYGGSYNFTDGQSLFAGMGLNRIGDAAVIGSWNGRGVFSINLLFKGGVISYGLNSKFKNEFIALLWGQKITDFSKKGKVFLKTGIRKILLR